MSVSGRGHPHERQKPWDAGDVVFDWLRDVADKVHEDKRPNRRRETINDSESTSSSSNGSTSSGGSSNSHNISSKKPPQKENHNLFPAFEVIDQSRIEKYVNEVQDIRSSSKSSEGSHDDEDGPTHTNIIHQNAIKNLLEKNVSKANEQLKIFKDLNKQVIDLRNLKAKILQIQNVRSDEKISFLSSRSRREQTLIKEAEDIRKRLNHAIYLFRLNIKIPNIPLRIASQKDLFNIDPLALTSDDDDDDDDDDDCSSCGESGNCYI